MYDFKAKNLVLDNASILITGGTGSFGQKFIATVLKNFKPKRLIVFSRDELKQYTMAQKFPQDQYPCMRYFIGDVRDKERLELAMRETDFVIHAAALKHVPIAEYNPMECVQTNIMGADNVTRAAMTAGVKKVIALSTDKASNPVNLYGASKLASDKIFTAANNISGHNGTRYAVVRYGNVMGSRGSVIPFFQNLIREGAKSLPITDDRMTRFWITLEQGIHFVLSSLELMHGGEVFVPKIPSMKVTDVATALAPNLKQEIIGIRPGEKLHEMMITADDSPNTIQLKDRYVIGSPFVNWKRDFYQDLGATLVEDRFHYSSDTNTEWLDIEKLRLMLEHEAAIDQSA